MTRSNVVIAMLLGTALAACQRGPEKTAAQASPNPPSSATLAPGQAASPASPQGLEGTTPTTEAPAPAVAPARTAARSHASARRTPARTEASRRVERVDHLPPAAPMGVPETESRRGEPSEPAAAREPNQDRLIIPAGTELQLVLENGLSSATSREGDPVTARVTRATGPDGRVLLPGGTVLKGRVYRAEGAGRVSGKAHLAVDFDRIVVRGQEHRLATTAIEVVGPDSHGRDAAIIGGSTVGGAIVGAILGGGSGAKKGAVIGAVGGTGAVLATKGREVEIPANSQWTVRVKDRLATD